MMLVKIRDLVFCPNYLENVDWVLVRKGWFGKWLLEIEYTDTTPRSVWTFKIENECREMFAKVVGYLESPE